MSEEAKTLKKHKRKMHPNSLANLQAPKRWKKGESGKPRSLYDIQAAARKKSPEAFKTIIKVMEDEKTAPSLKVKCAEIVLERAFGKAAVAVDVDVKQEIDHRHLYLQALKTVNKEFEAEKQKNLTRENGKAIVDKSYLDVTASVLVNRERKPQNIRVKLNI